MMKAMVFGMNCKANTICRALACHPKKKSLSGYGDSGTNATWKNIEKQHTTLLTSGKLNTYLSGINEQAQERFERLIDGMKQAQGITEQLKAENALEWVGRMNNIRACAMEIVNKEIIFA